VVTESERGQTKPRARIESLADLIFGLALSVGAISLVSSPPTDVSDIFRALFTFGFSFFTLIIMWLRYTRIMSVFPLESRRVIALNILLLFCVSIEPFLFNLLRNPPFTAHPGAYADTTSTLYALDLGALLGILGGFSLTLASDERKLLPRELVKQYRVEGAVWILAGLTFAVSALPVFYTIVFSGTQLRFYLWIFPLAILYVGRQIKKRQEKAAQGP
jgi:uncharacterized membrane protein